MPEIAVPLSFRGAATGAVHPANVHNRVPCIQGHAPRTEGEKYGEVKPAAMLDEIRKHPRYEVKATLTVDRRRKQAKT
jgi:hypothetical protein